MLEGVSRRVTPSNVFAMCVHTCTCTKSHRNTYHPKPPTSFVQQGKAIRGTVQHGLRNLTLVLPFACTKEHEFLVIGTYVERTRSSSGVCTNCQVPMGVVFLHTCSPKSKSCLVMAVLGLFGHGWCMCMWGRMCSTILLQRETHIKEALAWVSRVGAHMEPMAIRSPAAKAVMPSW